MAKRRPGVVSVPTVDVLFTRDYQVNDEEGKLYKKGQTYLLPQPSAAHFMKRGAAVLASETDAVPEPAGEPDGDDGTDDGAGND